MKIQEIKIDQILISDRIRPVSEVHAETIAKNIAETVQHQPILVRPTPNAEKPYTLVFGAHRLEALTLLGRETILCESRKMSPDEAKLAEIDENLIQHDLNVLDRAKSLAQRKEAYESLYPETTKGGDRKSPEFRNQNEKDFVLKFTADAAEKVGMSERSVELAVSIAKKLTPEAEQAIRNTSSVNNQSHLLALCKLTPADQKKAVKQLDDCDLPSAIAKVQGKKKEPAVDDGGLANIHKAFDKASKKAQQAFFAHLTTGGAK